MNWLSLLGKMMKFSFSEPRLKKSLEEVKQLNQDFCTIVRQTTLLNNTHQKGPLSDSVPSKCIQEIKECRMTQNASGGLYQALERACQMHEEHWAYFRLESQLINVDDEAKHTVRFDIGFAHRPDGSSATLDLVWIVVESISDKPILESSTEDGKSIRGQADDALNDLSKTLKRGLSQNIATPTK
jgi:hypothetical protein